MPDASPPETPITLPSGPGAALTDAARSVPMTPPAGPLPRWMIGADWLLLGLVALLGFLAASGPALNSDVWMQLATGRLLAHGDYAFGADPFSFASGPWVNHSWLFALALYLLHCLAGGVGLIVAKGLLVAGLVAVLAFVRPRGANLLVGAVCLALAVLALTIRLPLHSILVSYLFLGVTLLVLQRAGAFAGASARASAGVDEAEPDARGLRGLWLLPALFLLWVNLDNWFVLGPITVALAWLGLALQRWRGLPVRLPLGRLGAVLGLGLLACVVNPFHVRAAQLPPELAYVAVRGADAIGLPMPDALVAGGRTLSAIQAADAKTLVTASPLADGFYRNPHLGFTIAGLSFFVLLALGLASFILMGVVAWQLGGPGPQGGRYAVWLFFALLAISQFRLIPLFAIVAGPIAAMNLAELLAWYARPRAAGAPAAPWVAPARLARLLCVPLVLILVLLAWPGWLNGPFDLGSRLHVGWDVPVDVSMQKAAEALAEVAQEAPGTEVHVFNTGVDVAHYCAWFAPGVKCFVDGRYNLFAQTTEEYLHTRAALKDKRLPASGWSGAFQRHRIGHVAYENFLASPSVVAWWAEPSQWLQRFADRKVAVFSWSHGQGPWPADATLDRWNALAFGAVAPADRPAAGGVPPPQERGLFDRYLYPAPPLPEPVTLMDVELAYSQYVNQQSLAIASQVLRDQTYVMHAQPGAAGAFANPWAIYTSAGMLRFFEGYGRPFFTMADVFPRAVPVLMTRQAWTALAASPDNERCYLALASAYTRVKSQEAHWAGAGSQTPTLRTMLRRVQVVAALRTAAEIGFTDPALQFEVHHDLANLYFERYFLDLALDQLTLAAEVLEANPPDEPKLQEEWRKKKTMIFGQRDHLKGEVEKRRKDLNLKTSGRKPLEKVRIGMGKGYSVFNKNNEQQFDPRGWGLPGMVLQFLDQVQDEKLSAEEQRMRLSASLELLFNIGEARPAAALLDKAQGTLGPLALQFRVYRAATQGDYDDLSATLAEWERALAREALKGFHVALSVGLTAPPSNLGQPYAMLALSGSRDPGANWVVAVNTWYRSSQEYFNVKTLRGVAALEAGDTAAALQILQSALRESKRGAGFHYPDRPIAERYVPLLERWQKQ